MTGLDTVVFHSVLIVIYAIPRRQPIKYFIKMSRWLSNDAFI